MRDLLVAGPAAAVPAAARLLKRDLPALCAFVAFENSARYSASPASISMTTRGLTPGLFERVADVAYDWLTRRDRESMLRAPLFPRRFQACRGALSTSRPILDHASSDLP